MHRPARLATVIAHRGASAHAPENTLAAIVRAADDGARAVEIDVNVSADGVPYVHHDERLLRCTGHPGRLHEQSAAVLDVLHAGCGMPGFEHEPLVRLDTLLGVVLGRGLALNLEIKPPRGREALTAEAICDVLERCWPDRATLVISSFSETALRCAAVRLPDVTRALLVGAVPEDWREAMHRSASSNLHCAARHLDTAQIAPLHAAGHAVYCFTVNEVPTARRLIDAGADGVITDDPGALLAGLQLPA